MTLSAKEDAWATWMRAGLAGDQAAYRRFLEGVTPHLRATARRRCERFGIPAGDAEDIVQEVLLAIHLKRGTWDSGRPIGPWISAITRNKLIDGLRRRGRRIDVPIDDVIDTLEAEARPDGLEDFEIERMLERLKEPQKTIVRSISVDGVSIRDMAARLAMSEGAVRVALHRGLKSLATLYRSDVS